MNGNHQTVAGAGMEVDLRRLRELDPGCLSAIKVLCCDFSASSGATVLA